jgi:hypothetical protein
MPSSECNRCGKPLKREESVRRGYGPVCWEKRNTPLTYRKKSKRGIGIKISSHPSGFVIRSAAVWTGCATYPTLCPAISIVSKLYLSYKIGEQILKEWEKSQDGRTRRARVEKALLYTSYPLVQTIASEISSNITSSLEKIGVIRELSTNVGVDEFAIATILEKTICLSLGSTGHELVEFGVRYLEEGLQ